MVVGVGTVHEVQAYSSHTVKQPVPMYVYVSTYIKERRRGPKARHRVGSLCFSPDESGSLCSAPGQLL